MTAMLALLRMATVTWLSKKNPNWKRSPLFGIWPRAGFHGVQAPPNSSTPGTLGGALNGLVRKPALKDAAPGPCAIALKDRPCLIDDLTMCVWSSNTNRSSGGALVAEAAGSNISTGSTSKNFPYTSFIATKHAAIPPDVVRNFRRFIPSFLAAEFASSLILASTRFCFSVWGMGMYSPLETIRVGTGDRNSSVSAGAHLESCSSLNQASSSRDPGARVDDSGSCDFLFVKTAGAPKLGFDCFPMITLL